MPCFHGAIRRLSRVPRTPVLLPSLPLIPCSSDGRVLDDLCTLGDYSVQAESTLTLAVPLAGGKVGRSPHLAAAATILILHYTTGSRFSCACRKGAWPDPQGRQANGQAQAREGPCQASPAVQPAVQEHRGWRRRQEEGAPAAPVFAFALQFTARLRHAWLGHLTLCGRVPTLRPLSEPVHQHTAEFLQL